MRYAIAITASVLNGQRAMNLVRPLIALGLVLPLLSGCAARSHRARTGGPGFEERGIASWYGPGFHGKLTANGEVYDMHGLTAAHKKLPFGTIVEVRNRENGRSVRVRINDRGPFVRGRIIDLSRGAAEIIGLLSSGIAQVSLRVVSGPETEPPGDPRDWLVQAGAFRDLARAESHLQRVSLIDRRARLEIERGMHRVVIGPLASKRSAGRVAASLERRGISAFVRRAG